MLLFVLALARTHRWQRLRGKFTRVAQPYIRADALKRTAQFHVRLSMARLSKISIDLGTVSDARELHHVLMERLDFPGWYGCNWDAFWDAITGLVEMPELLEIENWKIFSARLPDEAKHLETCLQEMAEEFPQSASKVVYA